MTARLARILVYPVKSLDGVDAASATFMPGGALCDDRRLAIVDAAGEFVNGKRTAAVHGLVASYDDSARMLRLRRREMSRVAQFHLDSERTALDAWLSDYFGFAVMISENRQSGFPDDLDASGPTVISTATLTEVAGWFEGLTVDDVRQRFRANLEIDGVEPFWEDRLYGAAQERLLFRVGDTLLAGTNPCQRCVVPTRSPQSGQVWSGFAKRFAERRNQSLPAWADRSRFDHFYRLATNTCLVKAGTKGVCVGDAITIVGVQGRADA